MAHYEEWIKRAKSSLKIPKTFINVMPDTDIYYEDLCYQTQQAVEKAFKGFLIYFKVEPEFTHNIETLLVELEKFIIIPPNIREAIDLTKFAILTRYPGEYEEITKEKYEEAVKIAQECLYWVEKSIIEIEKTKDKTT